MTMLRSKPSTDKDPRRRALHQGAVHREALAALERIAPRTSSLLIDGVPARLSDLEALDLPTSGDDAQGRAELEIARNVAPPRERIDDASRAVLRSVEHGVPLNESEAVLIVHQLHALRRYVDALESAESKRAASAAASARSPSLKRKVHNETRRRLAHHIAASLAPALSQAAFVDKLRSMHETQVSGQPCDLRCSPSGPRGRFRVPRETLTAAMVWTEYRGLSRSVATNEKDKPAARRNTARTKR